MIFQISPKQSSDTHRNESVSVMDHDLMDHCLMGVNSRVLDQK